MNPFMGGQMVMGGPRVRLGVVIDKATRDQMLSKIQAGTTKLSAVRAWIDTKLATDPTLATTFGQAHVVENFWGYMDMARNNQWHVDQAKAALSAASGWNLDEETMLAVNDWVSAVDIAYDAVKQYGKVDPITLLPGGTAPATTPVGPSVQTPPPSSGPSTMTILTIGGVAVVVVALAAFLWPRA
jgi:hypothetical protein